MTTLMSQELLLTYVCKDWHSKDWPVRLWRCEELEREGDEWS